MADEIIIENESKNEPETKGAENSEIERLKAALAKANSEAGNYRKQLRERQTAEEAAAAERAEKDAEREELLNSLIREKTEGQYAKRLMSLGLTEEDASKTAKGLPNGIDNSFFDGLLKYKAELEKNIRAEIIKWTPKLETSNTSDNVTVSKEQFDKMGYIERVNLLKNNPDLYDKYSKGD